jgi:hypothetical protein
MDSMTTKVVSGSLLRVFTTKCSGCQSRPGVPAGLKKVTSRARTPS